MGDTDPETDAADSPQQLVAPESPIESTLDIENDSLDRASCWTVKKDCKMYYISKYVKNHADALADCKSKGGKLFEPKDFKTHFYIVKKAQQMGIKEFLIGIHDKKWEGKFYYDSDNKQISWTNWMKGQPNNGKNNCYGDEDCIVVGYGGKWNDICCGKRKQYVCEKENKLCNNKPSKPKCPSQCTVEIKNLKTVMTAQYAYQRMVNKYQGMVNKYQRSVSLYMSKLESCKAKGGLSNTGNCKDIYTRCAVYSKANYCNHRNAKTKQWMQRVCKATCGICKK